MYSVFLTQSSCLFNKRFTMKSRNLDDSPKLAAFRFKATPHLHTTPKVTESDVPRAPSFCLPAASISTRTFPSSIHVASHAQPFASPFPFSYQPHLLCQVREEYRHYFRLDRSDNSDRYPMTDATSQSIAFSLPRMSKSKENFLKRALNSCKDVFCFN